jgi:hypothetical protein
MISTCAIWSAVMLKREKIFFTGVLAISTLTFLVTVDNIRSNLNPVDNMGEISNAFYALGEGLSSLHDKGGDLGELLILGVFAPRSSEVDYLEAILKINIRLNYANTIISCDFETGRLYYGFSNVGIIKKQNKWNWEKRLIQEGRYYKNAKGDSYDGGDTLLRDMYPFIELTSKDLFRLKERFLQ